MLNADQKNMKLDSTLWFLLFVAVALPWLRFAPLPFAIGLPEIIAPIVLITTQVLRPQARRHEPRSSLVPTLLCIALAAFVTGLWLTTTFVLEPFYGAATLLPVLRGLLLLAACLSLARRSSLEMLVGTGRLGAIAVSAAGIGLVAMPAILAPQGFSELVANLFSGDTNLIIRSGFVSVYQDLANSPLIEIPVDRGANLRHESALVASLGAALLAGRARRSAAQWAFLAGGWALAIITFSRSSLVGLLIGVVYAMYVRKDSGIRLKFRNIVLAAIAALAALYLRVPELLLERFAGEDDRSSEVRSEVASGALEVGFQSLLGTDTNTFDEELRPHIFLLDAALGIGIFGTVTATLVLAVLVMSILQPVRLTARRSMSGLLGGLLACLGVIRFFTAGSFLSSSMSWLALGVIVATATNVQSNNQAAQIRDAQQRVNVHAGS